MKYLGLDISIYSYVIYSRKNVVQVLVIISLMPLHSTLKSTFEKFYQTKNKIRFITLKLYLHDINLKLIRENFKQRTRALLRGVL